MAARRTTPKTTAASIAGALQALRARITAACHDDAVRRALAPELRETARTFAMIAGPDDAERAEVRERAARILRERGFAPSTPPTVPDHYPISELDRAAARRHLRNAKKPK